MSDITYPPCGFKKDANNTNGDTIYSNFNDNNNNDDNNGNTDNKHKNSNNSNIHFCMS